MASLSFRRFVKRMAMRASSRLRLITQLLSSSDGKINFQIMDNRSGQVFEVTAAALFYQGNWLRYFSCQDIRRIAFAALEAEMADERKWMKLQQS